MNVSILCVKTFSVAYEGLIFFLLILKQMNSFCGSLKALCALGTVPTFGMDKVATPELFIPQSLIHIADVPGAALCRTLFQGLGMWP